MAALGNIYSAVFHLLFSDLAPSSQFRLLMNLNCRILNIFNLLNLFHRDDVWKNLENWYDKNYFYDDLRLIKTNNEYSACKYSVSSLKRKGNVKVQFTL